jgi:PAS domain S-box-containing protein
MRRGRATTRKPAKPQKNIKAKRGTAAPRSRRVSASSKGRNVARLARKGEDPLDQLRLVIDTIPTLVWSCRPDGAFDYVSRRWSKYTGISAQDALGSGWIAAYHPDDIGKHQEKRLASLVSGEPVINEVRLRRADGQYRWHFIHGVPLRDGSGNIVKWYGAAADIEDRKIAEQERDILRQLERQAERELQVTIDTIPALVVRYRRDGSPEYVNQTWRTYTGRPQDPSRGAVHPDDLPKLDAAWRNHLATGKPFEMEHRLRRADGEYRWFFFRRVPLRDENAQVIRWYGAAHDIDDQKRAGRALQTAQAELAHVTRVTTLGEMSASIAHEVNQPLAAIVTNSEAALRWLGRDVPDLEEARAAIGQVVKEVRRAGEVIRRIREFSKKTNPQTARLDINEVLEEAVTLLRHEALRHQVTMELELESGFLPVRGDRIQLQQVIINLAMNGMQAMATVHDRHRMLVMRTHRQQSERVLVAVEDVGIGVKPEDADQLFNAFYTTKPGGLGMGLAICRSIIEAHGGRLWAEANVPRGAIFSFTVPAVAASASEVIQ